MYRPKTVPPDVSLRQSQRYIVFKQDQEAYEMTGESSQRTAIITGASRGLGLALARRLAEDGWTLIIDARGEESLENARAELSRNTRVIAIPGDVADRRHRAAMVESARE